MLDALWDWKAILEIAVLFVLFYALLYTFRGTRASVLKGSVVVIVFGVIGTMYLASLLQLERITSFMKFFLSGLAFATIVVFAPDMRRALARLSESPLLHPLLRPSVGDVLDPIVEAVTRLSATRTGALIVIEREIGLRDIVEKGVKLDAAVSASLLEGIFYPGAALHDGALIVQGERVAAAGCFLPLSETTDISPSLGTRHRAALGVTEETDAIAVVVSEETGTISLGVHGRLIRGVSPDDLRRTLDDLISGAEGEARAILQTPSTRIIHALRTRRKVIDAPSDGGNGPVAKPGDASYIPDEKDPGP